MTKKYINTWWATRSTAFSTKIMGFIKQPTATWSRSSTNMYSSWIKTWADLLRIPQPSDMSTCYVVASQDRLFFQYLTKLISKFMPTTGNNEQSFKTVAYWCSFHCSKCQNECVHDLTIRVSVAECDVFVLLFDFHLHCHETAAEGKLAPPPGSPTGCGAVT